MKLLSSWETFYLSFVASTFMSSHYLKAISHCGRDIAFSPVISLQVWGEKKKKAALTFFSLHNFYFLWAEKV